MFSALLFALSLQGQSVSLPYDIVYVRQPYLGEETNIRWPEVAKPDAVQAGSDLMLLHADGREEVLVDTETGAVTDPFVSFDGKWVYYSLFPDVSIENLKKPRRYLPKFGADIYKINLETREIIRLTFQEFTPNTGSGDWDESNPVDAPGSNNLGYGILNLGAAPIAGGKIIFTSNRKGFKPNKNYTSTNLQLFVMDDDGKNVTSIAPMTLSSAMHPTPLKDGRVIFSSFEGQGMRDSRLWGIWSIYPDGRKWEPVLSAYGGVTAFHFATQTSNGEIIIEDYYNRNNFGFGTLYSVPVLGEDYSEPKFYSANLDNNPTLEMLQGDKTMPFSPKGIYSVTPSASSLDKAAADGLGKYTHPSAAPNNDMLVVWSDGPVNRLKRPSRIPAVQSGIYLIQNNEPVHSPDQMLLVKDDPNYNEAWPRAVVTYKQVHGVDEPVELEWLPNRGTEHQALPEGTPYGLIGSSSFYNRETGPEKTNTTSPYGNMDVFNTKRNKQSTNWFSQGADAGKYDNSDIWAVRILAMEATTDKGFGPGSHNRTDAFFFNHGNERLRILGEIPLRKFDESGEPILDYTGQPDTSFLAKLPADTPFTFQTIDRNGSVLNMSQTWHQVRPGEVRADCGGCHAHSQAPIEFEKTFAASQAYEVWDLSASTPLLSKDTQGQTVVVESSEPLVNVEFYQDIRPIIDTKCVSCHTSDNQEPHALLDLDDKSIVAKQFYPTDYARLCKDAGAVGGYAPIIKNGVWRQTNKSRYIRPYQSRRSLLTWKIFGERLDGWTNEDHPTESVPGDVTTLPEGASADLADLDYTGSIMPPPNSGIEALSEEEKLKFVRWIDLGCPIDTANETDREGFGWFLDETRPALTLSSPRAGQNDGALSEIRVGFADSYTGIASDSFSITADFAIDSYLPGDELADLFEEETAGVWVYQLSNPISQLAEGLVEVEVKDNQGNVNRIKRTFSVE